MSLNSLRISFLPGKLPLIVICNETKIQYIGSQMPVGNHIPDRKVGLAEKVGDMSPFQMAKPASGWIEQTI